MRVEATDFAKQVGAHHVRQPLRREGQGYLITRRRKTLEMGQCLA